MGKYEEALERAKQGLPIDEVFPELKESEDEKIRKELISFVNKYYGEETKKEVLAYLEKQKEKKWSPSKGEMRVLYKLCYLSDQITDEDDTELTRLYQDLKREYFNGHSFENMFPSEKQKEQKPADLSEMIVHKEPYIAPVPTPIVADEQKPAEWSEEDKRIVERLIRLCTQSMVPDEVAKTCESWLKSLPERISPKPHWKPSEEQMDALNAINCHGALSYVGQQEHLISLYNDIKKL